MSKRARLVDVEASPRVSLPGLVGDGGGTAGRGSDDDHRGDCWPQPRWSVVPKGDEALLGSSKHLGWWLELISGSRSVGQTARLGCRRWARFLLSPGLDEPALHELRLDQ